DLTTHRNGDAFRLARTNECGELRAQLAVHRLLGLVALLREIDQSRGVDVDVVEARHYGLGGQLLDRAHFALRIARVLLAVDLEVVALQEDRALPAFAQRGREHHEGVLGRALIGVADLGARDLADHRPRVELLPGPEQRARGVVSDAADVDRRHGEVDRRFAAT